MNDEESKKLKNLLSEYGHSLTRIAGEKDLMKAMELRAVNELGIEAKVFKTVATALWNDRAKWTRDDLQRQVDLFDRVLGEESIERMAGAFKANLARAGATVSFDPPAIAPYREKTT